MLFWEANREIIQRNVISLELNVVVVGGLDEKGVHPLREAGQYRPVRILEDPVLLRDQPPCGRPRDGDDGQGGVEDSRGIVGEHRGDGVREISTGA